MTPTSIIALLLLVTCCSAAIIDELHALKQALSPKDHPTFIAEKERAAATWNPAADCLEVKNAAGQWRALRPGEIHTALVQETAHFVQAVGAAGKVAQGKQQVATNINRPPGQQFQVKMNAAGAWPLTLNNVYYPTTYPDLIRIALSRPAAAQPLPYVGNADFIKCGKWLMVVNPETNPPFYVQPVAVLSNMGHADGAPPLAEGMDHSYRGMFDGATEALAAQPTLADIRAVVRNDLNAYGVHLCGLVYAQTVAEVRRNHVTAILNPLLYQLMGLNQNGYNPTSVLAGGTVAQGCKHSMARAKSLQDVQNPANGCYRDPGQALEIEAAVRWLVHFHANHYRVANCAGHNAAHVAEGQGILQATVRGQVHANMGGL